jgi:hypothetical protein
LAAVTKQRGELATARDQLQGERAKLQQALAAQTRAGAELRRLLGSLELGPPAPEAQAPETPGEMPVTVNEMTECMGYPSLTLDCVNKLGMRWGKSHSAEAVDGVVRMIDGQAANRALLARVAPRLPAVGAPPARWRVGRGERLYYADVVAMFGLPERVSGNGRRFTAWWPVGAWAREASATVVDGVVTAFDGRPVDPASVCALVRQRAEAYRGGADSSAVEASVASAKACYRYAAETLLPERLGREARLKARDGLNLSQWALAPFDSVGTWIAPTNTPRQSITMRAAVDCTWTATDEKVTKQRRYVILTLVCVEDGTFRPADYAVVLPGD